MTKLRIAPMFGCLTIATGLLAGLGSFALAQSDPATQQIIERLTPVTRGIRVPGASPDGAAQPPTVQPAPVFTPQAPAGAPAPPAVVAGPPVVPPIATQPPPGSQPPVAAAPRVAPPVASGGKPGGRPSAPPQETTAAAGSAAISLAVFFPSGSWVLTPQAERELAPLGRALSAPQLANFRFRIEGHTDSVGDANTNQGLSERRAAAVRDYLIQRWGVSPARLQAVGLGESQLLVPTPDETPNPRNRRVQVINLDG